MGFQFCNVSGVEQTQAVPGYRSPVWAAGETRSVPDSLVAFFQSATGVFAEATGVVKDSSNNVAVGPSPVWVKVGNALSYTTFQAAATTKTNTLFSLAAAGIIHAVKLKQSTAFAGTLISAVTLSVGISGTVDKYLSAQDVLQAVSATAFALSDAMGTESHTAATNITITAESTGANLSALTAGAVDVWALISVPN